MRRVGLFDAVAARLGYVLALLFSLYILWTFGRTDGLAAAPIVMSTIVLGFPAAIGAAAARLIL